MKIIHYDLFAGIGGFSYALDTIFYDYEREHIFCEWEAFPTAVLKKHWPDATYYGDIADLVTYTESIKQQQLAVEWITNKATAKSQRNCTIVTGGFPCQPFSHAGRRQGTADDRYKWPEMFAVIQNVRPDWVIAENVRGLVTWNDGMVLETVYADLESEGYEVWSLVIPAVSVGAPHRRDRVWIIANNGRERWVSRSCEGIQPAGQEPEQPNNSHCRSPWHQDWQEAALATCHDGVDDGLPRWMDGVTISAPRHRKERLKACGNAIVPQVAMVLFEVLRKLL